MRNKFWALLICIHCLAATMAAQNPAKRQLVLPLSDGGFVAFRSETSASDNKQAVATQSLASLLYSQALAGENRIIHRVLTDADQRVIFGYDLWVNSDPITRKFRLAVLPADEAFRRTFLRDSASRSNDSFATFPKSIAPQTLDDGDAFSLELLVNQQLGVKIVDVVKVTFDRSTLRDNTPENQPRDFSLDAVSLAIKGYQLLIDGKVVARSKSTIGYSGSLLWFYVPERGRFIFSLVPREGYSFQKIGILEGNKIEFVANGEHYEWLSGTEILPNGGAWNLWVLHDSRYTPLFGPEKPMTQEKKSGILRKIEEAVVFENGSLTVRTPNPPDPSKGGALEIPKRVMVGGADSIEHLIPKSP
ncbi:MAG TPA: hypothetical protein VLA93_02700 [Pyrinomonadaceae bacterium]|nr:hypothetical protein [Pyrinomonadaceae bacterium]